MEFDRFSIGIKIANKFIKFLDLKNERTFIQIIIDDKSLELFPM